MSRTLAALILSVVALAASAQPLTAAQLMQRLSEVPASETRYTETRHSSLLKTPLTTSGRLVYRRPDHLEKHVLAPFVESTVIDGSRVTVAKDGQSAKRTLTVPAGPAQALVESLRATLAGDLAALERHFIVHVGGSASDWTMTLMPREAELSNFVLRVEIAGREARLLRMEVFEAGGDRTVTALGNEAR